MSFSFGWVKASLTIDSPVPAYYICEKCRALLMAQEVFQLEALENQNETLKHVKGFQKTMSIITICISCIALIVSIFSIIN